MAPDLKSNDYYKILDVPRNADDATLKKAYKKLAVKVSSGRSNFLGRMGNGRPWELDRYLVGPL